MSDNPMSLHELIDGQEKIALRLKNTAEQIERSLQRLGCWTDAVNKDASLKPAVAELQRLKESNVNFGEIAVRLEKLAEALNCAVGYASLTSEPADANPSRFALHKHHLG